MTNRCDACAFSAAYEEAVASGGFAFRTGYYDIRTGKSYGDGLQLVRIVPSEAR